MRGGGLNKPPPAQFTLPLHRNNRLSPTNERAQTCPSTYIGLGIPCGSKAQSSPVLLDHAANAPRALLSLFVLLNPTVCQGRIRARSFDNLPLFSLSQSLIRFQALKGHHDFTSLGSMILALSP